VTALIFTIVKTTSAEITVIHIKEKDVYTFYILDDPTSQKRVSLANYISAKGAKRGAETYLIEAEAFADAEVLASPPKRK
jgi:hypothetical protein